MAFTGSNSYWCLSPLRKSRTRKRSCLSLPWNKYKKESSRIPITSSFARILLRHETHCSLCTDPPPLRKNRHTFWWVQFGMWHASGFLSRSHSIYAVQCRLFVKTYLSGVHCYADDTQVYISFSPNLTLDQLSHGKLFIGSWYRIFVCGCLMNNLKLSTVTTKTGFLIIGTTAGKGWNHENPPG